MQLYFLTIVTNILTGLALAGGFLSNRFQRFSLYTDFMSNSWYRVFLGVLSLLIGIINLFPTHPDDIVILGDLLPSLVGMITGLVLIAEFVSSWRGEAENRAAEIANKVEKISGPYLTILGIIALVIGVLHIILPSLPLL